MVEPAPRGGPHPADPPRRAVRVDTGLSQDPLDPGAILASVADPEAGAAALFVGTVRDHHEGQRVTGLVYEAWREGAEPALGRVAQEVAAAFDSVRAVVVRHRLGTLDVGDAAIVAAVSAPHRAPAQEALAELVERVKAEVPIFKEERLAEGGTRWPGLDTG